MTETAIDTNAPPGANASGLSLAEGMRLWGNVLKLWRLCGHASCRRARRCRGHVERCFAANYTLLPEGVRDWLDGMAEAKEQGLSFEDAMDWLDGTEVDDAFRAWNAAVAASVMRYDALSSKKAVNNDEQGCLRDRRA